MVFGIDRCTLGIRYGHEGVDGLKKVGVPFSKPNNRRVRPSKTSILRDWYTRDYRQSANTKRGPMVRFKEITAEFSPGFNDVKDPAEQWRSTLFRSRAMASFTETYKDRSIMYDGMIGAFNKAVSLLGNE